MHKSHFRQLGVSAVEFGLIATLLFLLSLGIIEFGRFMYVWNTTQEITRHAAREATVNNFDADSIDAIQREAIFNADTTGDAAVPGGPEIASTNVVIRYLNANGVPATPMPDNPEDNIEACLDVDRADSCIRYVEASVCQDDDCTPVQYQPLIGMFPFLAIDIPRSTVIMPAESLGYRI
jgi:hypothetical protein